MICYFGSYEDLQSEIGFDAGEGATISPYYAVEFDETRGVVGWESFATRTDISAWEYDQVVVL